jgi:hypothetical protein
VSGLVAQTVAQSGGNQSSPSPGHGRFVLAQDLSLGGSECAQAHRFSGKSTDGREITRAVSDYNRRRGISRPLPKLYRAGRRRRLSAPERPFHSTPKRRWKTDLRTINLTNRIVMGTT